MFKISEPMWGSFLFDRLTRTEVESFCDCQMNKQNKTDKKNIKWRQRQQMWVHIMHLFKVLVWQEQKLPRHARRSLIFGWIIIMYFGFSKDVIKYPSYTCFYVYLWIYWNIYYIHCYLNEIHPGYFTHTWTQNNTKYL